MKSLKIALISLCIITCTTAFGIFSNTTLLGGKKESWYESLFNSNLSSESTKTIEQFSTEKPRKKLAIPEKCKICNNALQLKKDWVKVKPCNHIVHTKCMLDWMSSDWSQALENKSKQCPECKQNFEINNMKLSREDRSKIVQKPALIYPEYQLESATTLAKKSAITMLNVFGIFVSQSKLPWYFNIITPHVLNPVDGYYGLSSSPFHTSSKFYIKYWGKFLYTAVSTIIPTYVMRKKLQQHIWYDIVGAYSGCNYPNTLPNI